MELQQYQELLGLIQGLLVEQTKAKEKLIYQLEASKHDLEKAQQEVEHLRAHLETQKNLLATKDALIASKDELLGFLRSGFNRPN